MNTTKWVPPEKRSTAYYIFHVPFQCKIQKKNIGTIQESIDMGYITSFDKDLDRHLQNEYVTVGLSINAMVEYFKIGVLVNVRFEDTKMIYEYIQNHLTFWGTQIAMSFRINKKIPTDDLILLDEFAKVVYENSEYSSFVNDLASTSLGRSLLGNVSTGTRRLLINRKVEEAAIDPAKVEADTPVERPARHSLAEFFNKNRAG